jgi:hypothetical protein
MALLSKEIFVTPDNPGFYSRRKYKPLDSRKHEIRLLRIHPERLTTEELPHTFPEWIRTATDAARINDRQFNEEIHGDFICCSLLEPIDLDSFNQKYAALSYCAGKPTDTRRIMIDGYWFNAFANLEHALEGFRNHSDCESPSCNLLWADQACIDQFNYTERAHQVSFMRNIYERSEFTYVVLSTPAIPFYDVEDGAEALRLTNKYLIPWLQQRGCHKNAVFGGPHTGYSDFYHEMIYNNPEHPVCKALPHLFNLLDQIADAKWWTRAWVSQISLHLSVTTSCLILVPGIPGVYRLQNGLIYLRITVPIP